MPGREVLHTYALVPDSEECYTTHAILDSVGYPNFINGNSLLPKQARTRRWVGKGGRSGNSISTFHVSCRRLEQLQVR